MDVVWGILLSLCYRKIFYEKENNCNATVICLLSMLFSISTFASDIDTVQSENHHFTQDEMSKLVEQNIIYQEEIPVQLTDTKARTVVEATVRFRVHYDNTNGLAFSTEVIAVVGGGTFTKTALVTIP